MPKYQPVFRCQVQARRVRPSVAAAYLGFFFFNAAKSHIVVTVLFLCFWGDKYRRDVAIYMLIVTMLFPCIWGGHCCTTKSHIIVTVLFPCFWGARPQCMTPVHDAGARRQSTITVDSSQFGFSRIDYAPCLNFIVH